MTRATMCNTLGGPWTRAALAACLCSSLSVAQVTYAVDVFQSPQLQAPAGFGTSLLAADVNADGFDDLIVGEHFADVMGVLDAGRAWIFYGPTLKQHQMLAARPPQTREYFASRRGAAGDIDGDGHVDLLFVSPHAESQGQQNIGRAHLFLGPQFDTETLLQDPTPQSGSFFGWQALLRDSVKEGGPSILISTPSAYTISPDGLSTWFVGEVHAWPDAGSGASIVIENPSPQQFSRFGSSLMRGDPDGDGSLEVLVGRPGQGANPSGDIVVLSSSTLGQVMVIAAPPNTDVYSTRGFGHVHYVGDVTGDGVTDLVVGAPNTSYKQPVPSPAIPLAGIVFILDGSDFSNIVHAIQPPVIAQDGFFGLEVKVADLDVDGQLDIVVNTLGALLPNDDNAAHIYFGPDFTRLQTLHVLAKGFADEAAVGDFDGDGAPEVAVSALFGNNAGAVYRYDRVSLTASAEAVSVLAGASVDLPLDLGVPSAGRAYIAGLGVSGSSPGTILGPGSYIPLNFDAVTAVGLSLLGTGVLQGFTGTLDDEGRATLRLEWPAGFGAGLAGETLTVAAIAVGADGWPKAGSSAVEIRIEP